MDGTLLDLRFDNHFWREIVPIRYAQRHNLSVAAAKQVLFPRFKSMEGSLEWYCLDYWSRELNLDISGLKQEVSNLITVLPHAAEFLGAVSLAKKRLVLVTNAHQDSLELKLEKTTLHRFFDRIICAHDLGLAKEHEGFWEKVKAIEPFELESTLLVDDSLSVLKCARNFGIRHVLAVSKPDSGQSPREINEYPAINDFSQLLPVV